MKPPVFFVAIVIEAEAGAAITQFKTFAAQHFQTSRALNAPPHLTLVPPFLWPDAQVGALLDCLADAVKSMPPFILQLKNFNCFAPRVIYVDVLPNAALSHLQQALEAQLREQLQLQSDRQYSFHPHVTVAFKDLSAAAFPAAWAHFSGLEFEQKVEVNHVALLRFEEHRWQLVSKIDLTTQTH